MVIKLSQQRHWLWISIASRSLVVWLFLFSILLVAAGHSGLAFAEDAKKASRPWPEVKARFIIRYLKYMDWPKDISPQTRGYASICVHRGDILAGYLPDVAIKEHSRFKVKVREITKRDDFLTCHVIFISQGYEDVIDYINLRTQGKPVVTMSDTKDFVRRGGVTGFYVKPGTKNVTLQLNQKIMVDHGVVFDPDFVSIMDVYKQ